MTKGKGPSRVYNTRNRERGRPPDCGGGLQFKTDRRDASGGVGGAGAAPVQGNYAKNSGRVKNTGATKGISGGNKSPHKCTPRSRPKEKQNNTRWLKKRERNKVANPAPRLWQAKALIYQWKNK